MPVQIYFGGNTPPDPLPELPPGYHCTMIPLSGDLSPLVQLDAYGTTGFVVAVSTGSFTFPDPLPPYFYDFQNNQLRNFWVVDEGGMQLFDGSNPAHGPPGSGGSSYLNFPQYNGLGSYQVVYNQVFSQQTDSVIYGGVNVPAQETWEILVNHVDSDGQGNPYNLTFFNSANPHPGPYLGNQTLLRAQFELSGHSFAFPSLYLSSTPVPAQLYYIYRSLGTQGGGGGGGGKGFVDGLDILNTRTGLYIAEPGSGMQIHKFKTAFTKFEATYPVDTDATANNPTLQPQTEGESVLCFYRRGDATQGSPYVYVKRLSVDSGQTWKQSLDTNGKEIVMLTGKKWARIVVLGDGKRARGEAVIYNDASGKKADGTLDGTGLLMVDLYDPLGNKIGTYPTDGKGIAGKSADDAGFGVEYVNDRNHDLRVTFMSGGTLVYAVSVDEGMTWGDISAQMS